MTPKSQEQWMSIHAALCYLKWSTSPFWSNTVTTSESCKFITHQKYSRLKLSYRFLARIEEIFIVFWGVDSRFRIYLVEGTATGLLGFIQFVLACFGCISTSLLCLITLLSWYISSFIGLILVSSSSLADLVLSDSCNLLWHPFSVQVVDYILIQKQIKDNSSRQIAASYKPDIPSHIFSMNGLKRNIK